MIEAGPRKGGPARGAGLAVGAPLADDVGVSRRDAAVVEAVFLELLDRPGPDGASRLTVAGQAVFIKRRRAAPPAFFESESRGLELLARARSLRVPKVLAVAPGGIVLEDLGSGRPALAQWRDAGTALAHLHAIRGVRFGLDADGYCGDSPQENAGDGNGHRFFAERRLLPQARRARDAGLLPADDCRRVEALAERLPALIPAGPPVLVHGDLWTGNLHACADGELALIDGGAVHFGWAEADLAMLTLFGEPPGAFFAAYEAAAHGDSGWRSRAGLLNLYHLLNHLNLFGGGYLGAVRAVLDRFA